MRWTNIVIIAVMITSTGMQNAEGADQTDHPPNIVLPHEWVGAIIKPQSIAEPSGVVYHPTRKTLFVVSDEGDIHEFKTDGTPVNKRLHGDRRMDYEGITVNPATGLLYIVIEGDDAVIEVDPGTLETKRRFVLDRTFKGKTILKPGGQGIEGITFVPAPKHPEGGTFLVTNQSFTLDDPLDLSAIVQITLPLVTGSAEQTTVSIDRCVQFGVIDLSGMHYDAVSKRLYVISDATNTLWQLTPDLKVIRGWAVPGKTQEGFTIDAQRYAYIAQDEGGVIKIRLTTD